MRRMFSSGVTPTAFARRVISRSSLLLPGALLILLVACKGDKQMHGVMIDPPRTVSGYDFTLPSGARISTAAEKGHPLVVFFGYTHCPDVCPTTLADWKRAKQKLGSDGDRVRFVFVTIDPERDTPVLSEKYAKQFDTSFVGVTGDSATTQRMMKDYGVSAARETARATDTSYFMAHSAQAFLVDDKGRVVAIYPFGIGWDALAADLKTIL